MSGINNRDQIPTLATQRLVLRPFVQEDVPVVVQYCVDPDFARTTLSLPWPYLRHHATEWIDSHARLFAEDKSCELAVVRRADEQLVGSIALRFDWPNRCAEIGYGIYCPFWKNGYATESAREMIRYGFEERGFNRIHSHYFACNPGSGRVMQKCGMVYEGTMLDRVFRFDSMHDIIHYAILKSQYDSMKDQDPQ